MLPFRLMTHCPVRLHESWTRDRVKQHISKSVRCTEFLAKRGPVICDSQARALDAAEQQNHHRCKIAGRHMAWAECPWVQLQGPLLPRPLFDGDDQLVLFLPEQPLVQLEPSTVVVDLDEDAELHPGIEPPEECDIDVTSGAG